MRFRARVVCGLIIAAAAAGPAAGGRQDAGPRIEVTFAGEARAQAVTGMVYVAISRDTQRTPIEQTSPTGAPLFSKYVADLAPGAAVAITGGDRGHPVRSLRDLPPGQYWLQPFVNVYTRFPRADGKTVWLHNDQWEGQNWKRSPGNLFGDPVNITFDPRSATPIRLTANKVIPPVQVPADTDLVKRIKIQSDILTKWWGQPMHLGATVLLPKDYDEHPAVRYPVNYIHGHFSLGAPGGFGRGGDFDQLWLAADTPRFIYVALQHLNDAVEKLNDLLAKTQDPKFAGEVVFQRRAPHCWGPRPAELLQKMTAQIQKVAPAGADLRSWKYR